MEARRRDNRTAGGTAAAGSPEDAAHPARELSLHLLRMLETRMDAAGIVLQAESQRLLTRLQLQTAGRGRGLHRHLGRHRAAGDRAAADTCAFRCWAPWSRLFVIGAAGAWLVAAPHDRGPRGRFAELVPRRVEEDLEVLARALSQSAAAATARTATESAQ